MSNTIGSSPRPATPVRASSASASTGVEAPAAPVPTAAEEKAQFEDRYGTALPSKIPLGETIHPTQTAEEIKNMSPDQLKAFKGEEIMGMNKNQFDAFETAVSADGGPGMKNLDPQARKAMLRKNMMKAIMEDCQRIAQKHEKNAF
jgi:hypothetical protein